MVFLVVVCLVALGAGYVFMRRFLASSHAVHRRPLMAAPPSAAAAVATAEAPAKSVTRKMVTPKLGAVPTGSALSPESLASGNSRPSSPTVLGEDTPTSSGRVRGLSVKRSNESPLTNLQKLRLSSQSRLPRQEARPKVALSEAEVAGIEELKARLERDGIQRCAITGHHASDDSFIGRFVRGKRLDLDAAYAQLIACLQWRKEQRIDTICTWYRQEFSASAEGLDAYYPWQDHGLDRNGVNVVWDRLPSMDFRLLMNSFSKEELIYWHLEKLEINMQNLYECGQYGGVFIEDFTGLSMAHWYAPAVDFLKMMMAVDQQNYPELSAAIFYTNAPRVLSVLWPLVKPFMDPLTVAKVHICSDGGAEQLAQFMEPASIPVEYGGQCNSCVGKHADGKCLDYTKGGHFLSTKSVRYTSVHVPAKAAHDVKMEVETLPATLAWKFMCAASGETIDMELLPADADKHAKPLLSVPKVSVSEGKFEFQQPGHYVMRFSNSTSFWSGRTVGYSLFVGNPLSGLDDAKLSFDSTQEKS